MKNTRKSHMFKSKEYRAWINSTQWRRLRHSVLEAHPLCRRCEEQGIVTAASEVHHRLPVEWGQTVRERAARMFDINNLVPLCHDCHVLTHVELGRGGRAANERSRRNELSSFIEKYLPDTNINT